MAMLGMKFDRNVWQESRRWQETVEEWFRHTRERTTIFTHEESTKK